MPLPAVRVRFRNLAVTGRTAVREPAPYGTAARLRAAAKVGLAGDHRPLGAGRRRSRRRQSRQPGPLGLRVCTPQGAAAALAGAGAVREVPILQACSGVLRPGRFTLLLGPPGCGKSTLLRALAGRLGRQHGVQASHRGARLWADTSVHCSPVCCCWCRVAGAGPVAERLLFSPFSSYPQVSYDELSYNGRDGCGQDAAVQTAAYVPQAGLHIGELTVRDSLDFIAQCRSVAPQFGGRLLLCAAAHAAGTHCPNAHMGGAAGWLAGCAASSLPASARICPAPCPRRGGPDSGPGGA